MFADFRELINFLKHLKTLELFYKFQRFLKIFEPQELPRFSDVLDIFAEVFIDMYEIFSVNLPFNLRFPKLFQL